MLLFATFQTVNTKIVFVYHELKTRQSMTLRDSKLMCRFHKTHCNAFGSQLRTQTLILDFYFHSIFYSTE